MTKTIENLKAAIVGETHEFESMYPEFIAVAEEEGQKAAVRSLTWATEAEKEHADFYSVALNPGKRRYQFPAQATLDMPGLRRHVQISGRRGCVPPLRHQG